MAPDNTCPDCNGKGFIYIDSDKIIPRICDTCEGTGEKEEEKDDTQDQ